MHERITREKALVMYFEEKRSLKEISQRLMVPEQTIKSWIGRYKRKYGLYGRREPLKEITEVKAKFHLLPPLPPITKKQYEKRIKDLERQVVLMRDFLCATERRWIRK